MEAIRRENRVLRLAVIVLVAVVAADLSRGDQTQPFPGPGTGIVNVNVLGEPQVEAAQRGEWRVAQQGNWRVRVEGGVSTQPMLPNLVQVGDAYAFRGASLDIRAVVREVHPSGWARVVDDAKGEHWINLNAVSSIRR